MTTLVHLSDIHFGGLADIRQLEAVEAQLPDLAPTATIVSGDHSQRARAGELQRARAFFRSAAALAPVQGLSERNWSVRWTGTVARPRAGLYRFAVYGSGLTRVSIDGKPVVGFDKEKLTQMLK
ncbi:MAG: PA14 domain-containing protein [Gemmatimonadales bacterium]|nr:PA14 domain-containing protein [Gemmatimonadales bacterium]